MDGIAFKLEFEASDVDATPMIVLRKLRQWRRRLRIGGWIEIAEL